MDNINEIKAELDRFYKIYKKNKSSLNVTQTNDVVHLLKKLSQNGDAKDVAERLVVFSERVCSQYFDELTSGSIVPIEIVESIINNFIAVNNDTSKERFYVKKYATMVIKVINNYTNTSYESKTLAKLIALVAFIGLKSDENKTQFLRIIQETKGAVYLVDYTSLKERSLSIVNKMTEDLLHSENLKAYSSLISDWSIKYGFAENTPDNEITDNKVQIEESVIATNTPKVETDVVEQSPVDAERDSTALDKKEPEATDTNSAAREKEEKQTTESVSAKDDSPAEKSGTVPESKKADSLAEKPVANTDEKASTNTSEAVASKKAPAQKSSVQVLYERLKRDMDKEQEAIITAFTDMITPVGKAFESIQGEISKSREIGAENVSLKAKVADLERQLSEQRDRFQTVNQSLMASRTENEELKIKVAALESQNAELDSKLNDAYAINSRESSLEAEKIRSELKKAFAFLYEDWLEYEFSDVSEDNYESLQAIIKKIFRSLERNGIDFKGNN